MPLPVEGYETYRDPETDRTVIRPAREWGGSLPVEPMEQTTPPVAYIDNIVNAQPSRIEESMRALTKAMQGLAEYDQKFTQDAINAPGKIIENPKLLDTVMRRLTGSYGEERHQTWLEKMAREGITAAGDVATGKIPMIDAEGKISEEGIKAALDIAGLAGTGGLGAGAGVKGALGSTPLLRPALRYGEKLYKGKEGQQHLDVLPKELQTLFEQQAMSGEDISNFNFGFVNHKGQFLDREAALKYAIDNGLASPHDAQFGALTSTMMNDNRVGTGMAALKSNEGLAYLIAPKSQAGVIGKEAGKFNKDGFSNFKIDNDGYLSDRIVYSENGQILGAMQITRLPNGKPTVANTYVDPASRRAGIATKLNTKAKEIYGELIRSEGPSEAGQAFRDSLLNDNRAGTALAAISKSEKPFYSALERAVEGLSQSKASGDQWLATLANKAGIKPEEVEFTGLGNFLKGKPNVSKAEVSDYLKVNGVGLNEVWKGGKETNPYPHTTADEWERAIDRAQRQGNHDEVDRLNNAWEHSQGVGSAAGGISPTKYNKWQLAGGDNYRELLLTLPNKKLEAAHAINDEMIKKYGSLADAFKKWSSEEAAKYDEIHATASNNPTLSSAYKSSHWDEPNPLVHMRMNDRTIPDMIMRKNSKGEWEHDPKGLQSNEVNIIENNPSHSTVEVRHGKSLHLEEIQSDWHQQGRSRGYKSKPDTSEWNAERFDGNNGFKGWKVTNKDGKLIANVSARDFADKSSAISEASNLEMSKGVPDAPFKKNWHELALKRAIREAAEGNYQRLSWTPGEAQAARYDLSKHIQDMKVLKHHNSDTYTIDATLKGKSERQRVAEQISAKELPNFVGKEMAEKIVKDIQAAQDNRWGVKNKASGNWSQRFSSKAEAEKYQKDLPESLQGKTEVLEMIPKYATEYSNLDLKVGGEGMKGFYDKIVPKTVERLTGEKVKTAGLAARDLKQDAISKYWYHPDMEGSFKTKAEAEKALAQPVHYIDITPALREKALKGFPLFSTSVPIPMSDEDAKKYTKGNLT